MREWMGVNPGGPPTSHGGGARHGSQLSTRGGGGCGGAACSSPARAVAASRLRDGCSSGPALDVLGDGRVLVRHRMRPVKRTPRLTSTVGSTTLSVSTTPRSKHFDNRRNAGGSQQRAIEGGKARGVTPAPNLDYPTTGGGRRRWRRAPRAPGGHRWWRQRDGVAGITRRRGRLPGT